MKLQRGLAWTCGNPTVPRMQPSIAPSRGSHRPVRLCLSSPCPCVVRDQAVVQVSPLDLYSHASFLAFFKFFFCCSQCLGSRTNSGQSRQKPAAGHDKRDFLGKTCPAQRTAWSKTAALCLEQGNNPTANRRKAWCMVRIGSLWHPFGLELSLSPCLLSGGACNLTCHHAGISWVWVLALLLNLDYTIAQLGSLPLLLQTHRCMRRALQSLHDVPRKADEYFHWSQGSPALGKTGKTNDASTVRIWVCM